MGFKAFLCVASALALPGRRRVGVAERFAYLAAALAVVAWRERGDRMLLREFCAENMERVPAAIGAGAKRIELCDNLARGGTSPSAGVVHAACAYGRSHGADVMVMVRPRGGDFAYSADELAMMRDDIDVALGAGAAGVVFGCEREGHLDTAATQVLLARVHEVRSDAQVTFHMAFDEIRADEQLAVIDWLAERGVTRILTHGGPAGTPIEDNLPRLRAYVERAAGRIGILPGGGVTWQNCGEIARSLGVSEVHGTKIVRL